MLNKKTITPDDVALNRPQGECFPKMFNKKRSIPDEVLSNKTQVEYSQKC